MSFFGRLALRARVHCDMIWIGVFSLWTGHVSVWRKLGAFRGRPGIQDQVLPAVVIVICDGTTKRRGVAVPGLTPVNWFSGPWLGMEKSSLMWMARFTVESCCRKIVIHSAVNAD